MAEAAVEVNFPGPAPYEHRVSTVGSTTGTDTTEEVVTPRQEAAQVALEHQTEDEVALARRKQAQAEKVAGAELQNVEAAQFVEQGLEALRTGPEAQKARDYIDMARARLRSEQDRLDKMPAPALFADRDAWGKVRLGVGFALAGLGDGMMAAAAIRAGHAPPTHSTAQTIIENDLNRQREAINKQRDTVVRARAGVDDAKEARNILLADVELKGKAMYRQLELLQRARLAALKLDQPSIDATKEILDANRAQKEQEAKFADAHGKNVKSRWDSAKTTVEDINRTPATGGEAGKIPGQTAALARQALAEIDKLEKGPGLGPDALKTLQDNALVSGAADTAIERASPLTGPIAMAGRAIDAIPRNRYDKLSEQDRITAQTMDRMQQMLLHVMSGANAPTEEMKKKAESFGWVPNDTPASMKAKLQGARELMHQYTAQPAGGSVKPDAAIPPKSVPFTRTGVLKMKAITKDKNRTRKERDDATAYIRAAHAAGVD